MDSTPGLVVNKIRVEGVNSEQIIFFAQKNRSIEKAKAKVEGVNSEQIIFAKKMYQLKKKLKLLAGDAHCKPLGKQGAFSVG